MSSFNSFDAELYIVYDPIASDKLGKDYWRVAKAFSFYIGDVADGRWVHIPEGYLTDGASVPRLFWSIIPPWGRYGQAVVVHDFLCEYLSITVNGVPTSITRQQADEILGEAMAVLNVPQVTHDEIVTAVALYRITSGKTTASNDPAKRACEADWFNKQEMLAKRKIAG